MTKANMKNLEYEYLNLLDASGKRTIYASNTVLLVVKETIRIVIIKIKSRVDFLL